MPRCPKCDYWVSREARTCEQCGRDLSLPASEKDRRVWQEERERRLRAAQESKTCMQEVREQWRQWKEDIQLKIGFCQEMFPDDEVAIQACIKGVIEGLTPPTKSFRRCWLQGFQCAFGCWDALLECTSDC